MSLRFAIVATHPIQYCAPVFQRLASMPRLTTRVFYGWEGATKPSLDHGFGESFQWDIPLLKGYDYTFVPNESSDPGTHHFRGIQSSQLVPLLMGWKPDAVLVFGWNYESHLQALRRLHGKVPVLFRGDSTLLDEKRGLRRPLRRAWLRWVYRHVDLALYVGSENKRYFEAHGLGGRRLMWAPHSIENTRFTNGSEAYETEAKRWRRQIGIADDDCVVLFAGKLEPKKAPDLLVRAFMARLANKPNVHLVFAGSGILESKLRVSIGETPNVHFLGFQNQSRMPVVYRLGDVFVLPSRGPGETWGLAVNEAMACCRAVVVSDRAGCATDLVRTGETGFAFPSERDGVLAGIIDTLVSDPALRSRIAQNGRRLIGEWSVETQAARIEKAVITCGGASVTC